MRGHQFTQLEREGLKNNSNILKVSNSNITYTEEFKKRAIYEYDTKGKSAKVIFAEAGIADWLNKGKYAKKKF